MLRNITVIGLLRIYGCLELLGLLGLLRILVRNGSLQTSLTTFVRAENNVFITAVRVIRMVRVVTVVRVTRICLEC
jgi:hypothetical protein